MWLITPDPAPGFTTNKLLKLAVRVLLFAIVATLISGVLGLTPLRPYLNTWWGSMLLVFALYIPFARFMTIDTFTPRREPLRPVGAAGGRTVSSAQRRKDRNRYAGVRKSGPKYGGRR
ncbi:hypothetical protein ASF71_11115 [Deinococcus sp. Leaf326]|nr:hypothetical protein ASF71_11115 [Deinococcus sp. Leaf326]